MSPRATDYDWEQTVLYETDFAAGESDDTAVSAGAQPTEVLKAEVGDNNGVSSALASYRAARPGGTTGSNPRSGEGKIFADVNKDASTDTDNRTQIRLIKRPKNGDSRTKLTRWFTLRELEEGDVEDRIRLEPATTAGGDPLAVQEGDVIAVEAKNPAADFEINRAESELELPFQVGY